MIILASVAASRIKRKAGLWNNQQCDVPLSVGISLPHSDGATPWNIWKAPVDVAYRACVTASGTTLMLIRVFLFLLLYVFCSLKNDMPRYSFVLFCFCLLSILWASWICCLCWRILRFWILSFEYHSWILANWNYYFKYFICSFLSFLSF